MHHVPVLVVRELLSPCALAQAVNALTQYHSALCSPVLVLRGANWSIAIVPCKEFSCSLSQPAPKCSELHYASITYIIY